MSTEPTENCGVRNEDAQAAAPYLPVPVEAAKRIGDEYRKHVVIIIAWDSVHLLTHCTTYGRTAAQKSFAALEGERIMRSLGVDFGQMQSFEDFRNSHAARSAARIELLTDACRAGLALVEDLPRLGVVAPDNAAIQGLSEVLKEAIAAGESR